MLIGLGLLPCSFVFACQGDDEHVDDASGSAGAGGDDFGAGAAAGAPSNSAGGSGGDPAVGVGGRPSGSGGAGSGGSGGGDPPDPPELPRVVTGDSEPCSITLQRADISPQIGTVGTIEFVSSWEDPDTARIEFGKNGSYDLVAPVETTGSTSRARLLGMTTASVFHYRIVLTEGELECQSEDRTIVTAPMPNGTGIGNGTVTPGTSTAEPSAGYFIGSNYNGNWLYILNSAGELVWYYETTINNISSIRLAPDGRYVYARTLNVARNPANGRVVKIAIDGSSEEELSLTSSHHDFNFGPEGSLVYIRKSTDNSCDSLYLHWLDEPDDSQDELIADLDEFFTVDGPNMMLGGESCHVNSVHYQEDGGYTASDLVHNAYVKVDELGQLEWVLGGGVDSTFVGDGTVWSRQHGHHLVAPDRLLFFNNQTSAEKTSRALEVVLDFDAGVATYAPFEYGVDGLSSQVLGDVRRLPNGNTLVTYSVGSGLLHEVDPYGERVRAIDLPGGACGYTDFRPSLYQL